MGTNDIKDYLGYENRRNKDNADLYVAMIKVALGVNADVLIGHHLTFELDGDLNTENEIPSADTLIFDHQLMEAIFGDEFVDIIQELAGVPVPLRDDRLREYFFGLWNKDGTAKGA